MNGKNSYHSQLLKEIREEKKKILTPEYRYALDIIADKMYKERHFIRELIQNADDAGSKKILFEIDTRNRVIRVTNWGKPFDEKDVRQICTMLPSEKKATQIGTLGVGFKSVFGISDCPKIFSGGFNFEIRDYVLPEEIEPIDDKKESNSTVFVIPIRNDIDTDSIIARFDSISGEMILFLNTINEIFVKYDEDNHYAIKKNIVTKRKFRNLKIQYVAITKERPKDSAESRFVVFKRKYKIPEVVNDQIRDALKKEMQRIYKHPEKYFRPSEINSKIERKVLKFVNPAIAIRSTKDWNLDRMAESKLFISLPTEIKTGVKFHINAEFKPSADRSGIEKDDINYWTISKVGKTICEMIEFMKNTKKFARQFYAILPDLEDIDRIDYKDIVFDKIFSAIKEYSRTYSIILTSNNKWAKSDEVCFCEHEEIEHLLTKRDLEKCFKKKYFVSSQLARGSKAFLRSIGIPTLTLRHFIEFFINDTNLKGKSPSWFFEVYTHLGKYLEKEKHQDIIETLRNSKILLVATGELLSPSDENTFLPLDKELDKSYYLFKDDIDLIHRDVVISLTKKRRELSRYVKRFFDFMGVKEYNPFYLIENIILPKYESDDWKKETTQRLFEYLNYIRKHIDGYEKNARKYGTDKEDPLQRMRNSLWIRTNRTENGKNFYNKASNLYFSSAYTREKDLEILFEGFKRRIFVHDMYLRKSSKKDKKSWIRFFKKLGVEDKPRIIVILEKVEYDYRKHRGLVEDLSWDARSATGWEEYIQYDKKSDDIKKILRQAKNCPFNERKRKMEKLIKILDRNWNKYMREIKKQVTDNWERKRYGTLDSAKWIYHRYDWYPKKIPSTLKCLLTSSSWIPTTRNTFEVPSMIYVKNETIAKLAGRDANFLTLKIQSRELTKFLEISNKAKTEDIIESLLSLTKDGYEDEKAKFLLKEISEPQDLAYLITKVGEEEQISKGLIRLANLAYEKFNAKILESERNDEPLYAENWWNEFRNKIRILTKNSGFCPSPLVFFPPSPHLDTILKRSKIENIPLLPSNWQKYETFARKVGVKELEYGSNVKYKLVEPDETEIVGKRTEYVDFKIKIKNVIPYANGAEAKKILTEGDRWDYNDVFGGVNAYCLPKLRVQYFVDDTNGNVYEGIPISTPVYLRQLPDGTELYIRVNVKNDKRIYELVANELSMLTNPKGDRDYMAKTIKECLLGFPPMDIKRIEAISQREEVPLPPPLQPQPPSVHVTPREGPPPIKTPPPEIIPVLEPPTDVYPTDMPPSPEAPIVETPQEETSVETPPSYVQPVLESETPETPPHIETPPEEPPRKPITVVTQRQIRDSKMANWVKGSYSYHCQVCLSKEKPGVLTYHKSYAGREPNRRSIMEAHHIKEVARDQGHDHIGNYLSLCRYHHTLLHRLNLSLDDLKNSLSGFIEKEIVWPNGEITQWKMVTLGNEFIEENQPIQMVLNDTHLEKLKEYINYVYSQ